MSSRTRAADDYSAIRERMQELKAHEEAWVERTPTHDDKLAHWATMASRLLPYNQRSTPTPEWVTKWKEISDKVGCSAGDFRGCLRNISGECAKLKACTP